ncbi:hypothetical protein EBB07_27310 [Paenibacillaceae bacterium]|nr:hypothetical protein EBB07_27310 [Paenibacillaceae bacterium]
MKKVALLLGITVAISSFAGHVWAEKSTTSSGSAVTLAPAEQNTNPYDNAGIDDPKEFTNFLDQLQKHVAKNNKAAVAELVSYPLRVNHDGKSLIIKTKKDFIARYNQIFTDEIKKKLLAQQADTVFVNWKGVMVGDGEIWIGQTGKQIAVIAVNR